IQYCVGIIISFITLILGLKEYIGYNDVVVMFVSFSVMAGIGGFLGKIADEINRKILEIKYKILSNISESKRNILKNVLISIFFVCIMSFIFVGLIFMPFGNPDIITIQSYGFSPNSTLISPSTVTWINNDTKIHRVVSDYGLFDSGNITPGQSYSHYFRDVKAYPYHDSIDPSMKGTVLLPMSPGE
ncbi:MAG: hypothetical protein K8E24_011635, partial [Methanobacterium paludis]|nr:hypothetical protein [Methanobacterium paludis]